MAQRVSQDATLALAQGTPKARVSQDATLALAQGSPVARVSQVVTLTLALTTSSFASDPIQEFVLP